MVEYCRCGEPLTPHTMGRIEFDGRHCFSCRRDIERRLEKITIEKVGRFALETVEGVLYDHMELEVRNLNDSLRDAYHLDHAKVHLAAAEAGDNGDDHLQHALARLALLLYQQKHPPT